MNARKVIGILGGVMALLIAAVVAIALWSIKKLESEKNAGRTAKARESRWKNKTPESEAQETATATQGTGELKIVPDEVEPNQQSETTEV